MHYTHFNILQYYNISLIWELELIAHAPSWVRSDVIFMMKVEFIFPCNEALDLLRCFAF